MSWKNGKVARSTFAIIGSACFLGGIAASSARLDAAAYLSLKPTTSGLGLSGNDYQGYTLTLAAGTQTFSYDVVVSVTNGVATGSTATPIASGSVQQILGAVRATSTGVTGAHVAYSMNLTDVFTPGVTTLGTGPIAATFNATTAGFTLNQAELSPLVDSVSTFGTRYAFRPGVVEAVPAGAIGGIGPQSGTFGQTIETAPSNGRIQLTYSPFGGLPAVDGVVGSGGPTSLHAMSATVQLTGTAGSTANISFVGGNGSTSGASSSSLQSYLQWTEGSTAFASGVGSAVSFNNSLTVVFVSATPAFVAGDFNFDGGFDGSDIDGFVSAVLEGDPFTTFIADNNAACLATYGVPLDINVLNVLGDFNSDGGFDGSDIDGFVDAILNGGRAAGPAIASVPEPSSAAVLLLAAPLMGRRRR